MVRAQAEDRAENIKASLDDAFSGFIREEPVEVIQMADVSVLELGQMLLRVPSILKPLALAANVAERAFERDLGIKTSTYRPRLDQDRAMAIAGYLKPFLPASVAVPTLVEMDKAAFIDKEIRLAKGRWEKRITEALSKASGKTYKKRMFKVGGETFEIDAAYPDSGQIEVAVDVKRIEARRDIHKRVDEIVNKARKLKVHSPEASFIAVVYFPFEDQHEQIRNRLADANVDAVGFAGETPQSISDMVSTVLRSV